MAPGCFHGIGLGWRPRRRPPSLLIICQQESITISWSQHLNGWALPNLLWNDRNFRPTSLLVFRIALRSSFGRKWLELLERQVGEPTPPPPPPCPIPASPNLEGSLFLGLAMALLRITVTNSQNAPLVFSCHEFRRRSVATWLHYWHSCGLRMPGSAKRDGCSGSAYIITAASLSNSWIWFSNLHQYWEHGNWTSRLNSTSSSDLGHCASNVSSPNWHGLRLHTFTSSIPKNVPLFDVALFRWQFRLI